MGIFPQPSTDGEFTNQVTFFSGSPKGSVCRWAAGQSTAKCEEKSSVAILRCATGAKKGVPCDGDIARINHGIIDLWISMVTFLTYPLVMTNSSRTGKIHHAINR